MKTVVIGVPVAYGVVQAKSWKAATGVTLVQSNEVFNGTSP